MPDKWHRHVMVNVVWNYRGWADMDDYHSGKSQFKWTRDNPDDHADAFIFSWGDLQANGGYAPMMNRPRRYLESGNDGHGILFITSREPKEGRYYIVGFLANYSVSEDNEGSFNCDVEASARFAVPVPLDVERHCPTLAGGGPRKYTFGENNFNYIRDEWARAILTDALEEQRKRRRRQSDYEWDTFSGEPSSNVIQRALKHLPNTKPA